jgi:3-methyladenine DNA glycosylase AlkD
MLRRALSRRAAHLPGSEVLAAATTLVDGGSIAERFVAYELVAYHPEAHSRLNAATLRRLGRGLDSWGAVDMFGCYLAGPAWRARQVPDDEIHRWTRSRTRWWRRAALVATVPLNVPARGGTGDARRTLGVCALLIDDRDDMVVKALSWALRALVGRDAKAVRQFLATHRSALAPRVRREVESKLTTGRKNPIRRLIAAVRPRAAP